MMKLRNELLNKWVILGAVGIAACLMVVTLTAIGWRQARPGGEFGFAPADLTVIPASTSTPAAAPTPTIDPVLAGTPTPEPGKIAVGVYVQISGTEGEGLRLRAAPGLNAEPLFMGYDAEAFQVREGPQEADGYVWWYLIAPYDETRAGWAAANYLTVIPSP